MASAKQLYKPIDTTSYLPDAKIVYAAIQEQISTLPAILGIFTDEPKWYECGAKMRNYKRCRKYAGHPGRHAKVRRG